MLAFSRDRHGLKTAHGIDFLLVGAVCNRAHRIDFLSVGAVCNRARGTFRG